MRRHVAEFHKFAYKGNIYLFLVEDMKAFRINKILSQEIDKLNKLKNINSNDLDQELTIALKTLNLLPNNFNKETDTNNNKNKIDPDAIPIKSISLNVAQICNMRCIYCYGSDGEYGEKGLVKEATAFQAIDWLIKKSLDAKDISIIFFGGEPLLNFRLIKKVVNYAKRKAKNVNKTVHFSITTNGTLFNDRINKFLNKNKFSVTISFDGDAKIQNKNRPLKNGIDSYEYTKPLIENFLKSRKGNATGRATITRYFEDLSTIRKTLVEIGFKRYSLTPVSGSVDSDYYLCPDNERKILIDLQTQADEITDLIKNRESIKSKLLLSYLKILRTREKKQYSCGAGKGLGAISINGDVYPCHRFVGIDSFKMGNVNGNNLLNREKFLLDNVFDRKQCNTCWARYFCGGGCYHENLVKK